MKAFNASTYGGTRTRTYLLREDGIGAVGRSCEQVAVDELRLPRRLQQRMRAVRSADAGRSRRALTPRRRRCC